MASITMMSSSSSAVSASAAARSTARPTQAQPSQMAPLRRSGNSRSAPVAFAANATRRGGSLRVAAAKDERANNPYFDPNNPMTWNAPSGGYSDDVFDTGVPVDDLMVLSDEQLAQLLGAEGATVPIMLENSTPEDYAELNAEPVSALDMVPETAAQGIDRGLLLYKDNQYPEALAQFTAALDLPGTGPTRRRKAITMPAGPSMGYAKADASLNEQIAIHYNCACCHARLDDAQAGLVSLVRAMEAGYDDYANIRNDADIANLRADSRFESIMARFEPKGLLEGVFAMLSKGTTAEQAKSKQGAPTGGGGGELLDGLFSALKEKLPGK